MILRLGTRPRVACLAIVSVCSFNPGDTRLIKLAIDLGNEPRKAFSIGRLCTSNKHILRVRRTQ